MAAALLAVHPGAAAAATNGQVWVPYAQLLSHARTDRLIRAIINPARSDVEIKFANLDEWHAYFPAGAQGELQALFRRRHVHVIFVPRTASAAARRTSGGHPLRWTLAGIAVAASIAGAALALRSRRRRAAS